MAPAEGGAAQEQKDATHLYNGVDRLWLALYGRHVHVGYYPDPAEKTAPLSAAQECTVDQIIAAAGLDSSVKKMLDIGCGVGGTSCHIAAKLGCQAIGVNISTSQVATANRLAQQQGLRPTQVHFVEGDAMQLPECIGTADVVLSFESACYMPDKRRFIQQLASRVEKGGKVVLVDFCRGPEQLSSEQSKYLGQMDQLFATAGDWHSAQDYAKMLEDEGLRIVSMSEWTDHIRGFWEARLLELLSAKHDSNASQADKRGMLRKAADVIGKVLQCAYLVLEGGWPTIKMTVTFLLAMQQRVVRGAFNSGALRYKCLVAVKHP